MWAGCASRFRFWWDCGIFSSPGREHPGRSLNDRAMKTIKTYPSRVEADLARMELEATDIPAVVVGIGVGMEGGAAGVRLLVPDDRVEAALKVLGDA